ncbi:MAG: hypothetical protein Q9218_005343, partial [Villophora microphyllina]
PPAPNGISSSRSPADMGAVFDELSQGEAVTSKLRKVDPASQTHKNPSLRAGSSVPPSGPARSDSQNSRSGGRSPLPGRKPESMRTKKPPKKELEGNKWLIENYDGNPPEGMLEVQASISHSILISRCTKLTIRVIGKANAISLDNCTQCSLVIDSLVSAVDVIRSPKFEMQVLGMLPTIMLDGVDGAQIYLGRGSLRTEVFTSKCSGVNINFPEGDEDDEYVERALPEQIKSVIRNGLVVTFPWEERGYMAWVNTMKRVLESELRVACNAQDNRTDIVDKAHGYHPEDWFRAYIFMRWYYTTTNRNKTGTGKGRDARSKSDSNPIEAIKPTFLTFNEKSSNRNLPQVMPKLSADSIDPKLYFVEQDNRDEEDEEATAYSDYEKELREMPSKEANDIRALATDEFARLIRQINSSHAGYDLRVADRRNIREPITAGEQRRTNKAITKGLKIIHKTLRARIRRLKSCLVDLPVFRAIQSITRRSRLLVESEPRLFDE